MAEPRLRNQRIEPCRGITGIAPHGMDIVALREANGSIAGNMHCQSVLEQSEGVIDDHRNLNYEQVGRGARS